jgi:hypothetical protein
MPELPKSRGAFREKVSPEEFEKAVYVKEEMAALESMSSNPKNRTIAASLIQEKLLDRNSMPRESKFGVFEKMKDLLQADNPHGANKEIASQLITVLMSESDSDVKPRLVAALAHDLQRDYIKRDDDGNALPEDELKIGSRIDAFKAIADLRTEEVEELFGSAHAKRRSAWAQFLLDPGEKTRALAAIYDGQPWEEIGQRIQEVESHEWDAIDVKRTEREMVPTGNFRALVVGAFPTLDKIRLWASLNEGTENPYLPVCMSQRFGNGELEHRYFGPERTARVGKAVQDYRELQEARAGKEAIEKARTNAMSIFDNEFMDWWDNDLLPEDQEIVGAAIDDGIFSLRLTTEVSEAVDVEVDATI